MAEAVVTAPAQERKLAIPGWLRQMQEDYRSKLAHIFIPYGNIGDVCDNSGSGYDVRQTIAMAWDDNVQKELETGYDGDEEAAENCPSNGRNITRIVGYVSIVSDLLTRRAPNNTQGDGRQYYQASLRWANEASRKVWEQAMEQALGKEVLEERRELIEPQRLQQCLNTMTTWFGVSRNRVRQDELDRRAAERECRTYKPKPSLLVTFVITDADAVVPKGSLDVNVEDREAVVAIRQWGRDKLLGDMNRVVLLTRHLSDIHESIRSAEGVATYQVPKPTFEDRFEYLSNLDLLLKSRGGIKYEKDFDARAAAVQAAGMGRNHIKEAVWSSCITKNLPFSNQAVLNRKQRALKDEYGGMVNIRQSPFGFEVVGGHEHLKRYSYDDIINPLKMGNIVTCSQGVLLAGPPGTGKTLIGLAMAKESGLNFVEIMFAKAFGGYVGDTEKNMAKIFDALNAAAPCIAFADEIESMFSSGRSSPGDSGTAARAFNAFMQYLSDESRAGKVVFVACTNRPDLLDAALIRAGRFDAVLPALAPFYNDARGRKEILEALCRKHRIGKGREFAMSKDLAQTEKDPGLGMGRLLLDEKRIWTGAEIEVLLKKSLRRALRDNRKVISVEDWNVAIENLRPKTGEIELQTLLALSYVTDFEYCPAEWIPLAKDEEKMKARIAELKAGL